MCVQKKKNKKYFNICTQIDSIGIGINKKMFRKRKKKKSCLCGRTNTRTKEQKIKFERCKVYATCTHIFQKCAAVE